MSIRHWETDDENRFYGKLDEHTNPIIFFYTDKYLETTDSSFNHSNERLPAYATVKIQWEMTWASSIWHRFLVGSRIPAFKTYDPLENSS